ncbi:ricin-type beta-trefoil lectin domain protein [Streptomyces sp. NPDC006339]|uniref:RICIN domain-containing protein n=1 Tax=Streptomyces sp. NPDC006339 TaxID=3156755 RepID=UPI0033B6FED9
MGARRIAALVAGIVTFVTLSASPAFADRGQSGEMVNWGPNGTKCATPEGNSTANGTVLTIWDCTGSPLQQFIWEHDYQIRHISSGKCITPRGNASGTDGAVLTLWPCDNVDGSSQMFDTWPGDRFDQQVWTVYGSKCITNYGNGGSNGTWMTLWKCNSYFPLVQNWHMPGDL